LQTSFGINMLALNGGRPEIFNLKSAIAAFIDFREEIITRRTIFELDRARNRAHMLVGLAVAVANLDKVIALIRRAMDPTEAREALMAEPWLAGDVTPLIALIDEPGRSVDEDGRYQLSETQARGILELRLHRLTGLERDKIAKDLEELVAQIQVYLDILGSRERLYALIREELLAARETFATPRRTEIVEGEFEHDVEDLIRREDMIVTVTHGGYIKRVPLSTYRAQRRGGKGRAGMSTRDEDFVSKLFVLNTHTPVLFFSSRGMVYKMKVYRLPIGSPQARGKALVNLLPLQEGETITTLMPLPEDEESMADTCLMFATAHGNVRRNRISDFTNVMVNGKIAMKLAESDRLVGVAPCDERDDVLLVAAGGKCIRFPTTDVRLFSGRTSTGVRGIRLAKGDNVISMSILQHATFDTDERDAYLKQRRAERTENGNDTEGNGYLPAERFAEMSEQEQFILSVTAIGFGKRSSAYEYRVTGRGGQGIANIDLGPRKNAVVASFPVPTGIDLVMVTDAGQLIRTRVEEIRIAGRSTRGVTLFRVAADERVVAVSPVDEGEDAEDAEDAESAAENSQEVDTEISNGDEATDTTKETEDQS
ncbi:MAG: DNA gyrase C-terminal beta-propeller domain-containing protein, partial [Alphaproteobacteria bacterium]